MDGGVSWGEISLPLSLSLLSHILLGG
jgi:hypothetical protein